jgi:hypothetical protein
MVGRGSLAQVPTLERVGLVVPAVSQAQVDMPLRTLKRAMVAKKEQISQFRSVA